MCSVTCDSFWFFLFCFFHFAATYEVQRLQELSRICIRHTLRVTPGGGDRVGRVVAGLHKYGPRFKLRRVHRRHCNALILATRQVGVSSGSGPASLDGNNNQDGRTEDEEAGDREAGQQVRGSRRAGRAVGGVLEEDEMVKEEDEEEQQEAEKKVTGEMLRAQPAMNVLRQRILGLPLPEPLKMYLLYYRDK